MTIKKSNDLATRMAKLQAQVERFAEPAVSAAFNAALESLIDIAILEGREYEVTSALKALDVLINKNNTQSAPSE